MLKENENSVKVSIYEQQYSEIKSIAYSKDISVKKLINKSIKYALKDYEENGYIECNNRIHVEDEENIKQYSLKVKDKYYNELKIICNTYDIKMKELVRQIILYYPYLIKSEEENTCYSLIKLYKLSKNIFDYELDKEKVHIDSYSRSLYKRVLKITNQIIKLLSQDDYISVPILTRTVIEAIVDISNIKDYGVDYVQYLRLTELIRKYEFYNNNYNDYCYITNNEDNINVGEIKDNIQKKEEELLYELSKNNFNNELRDYISQHITDDKVENINYKELKKYFTINNKLKLLINKNDRKRNIKYKTWFYIMSQHTHNSIDFIQEYDGECNLEDYKDLVGSLLKNGLIYLAEVLDTKIHDTEFKLIRKLKKQISNDINLWQRFDLI